MYLDIISCSYLVEIVCIPCRRNVKVFDHIFQTNLVFIQHLRILFVSTFRMVLCRKKFFSRAFHAIGHKKEIA